MIIDHPVIIDQKTPPDGEGDKVYGSPLGHFHDELSIIDFMLQYVASRIENTDDIRFPSGKNNPPQYTPEQYHEHLPTKRRTIADTLERTRGTGVTLPWCSLIDRFRFDDFEQQVILLCLAAWFDENYCRLYSWLIDGREKCFPSVELALLLNYSDRATRFERYADFSKCQTIFKWNIIEPVHDRTPGLTSLLRINERIANFLLGNSTVDMLLEGIAQVWHDAPNVTELLLDGTMVSKISGIANYLERRTHGNESGAGEWFYFQGPSGSGKRTTAGALCRELGLPLLVVDIGMLQCTERDLQMVIRSIVRESILQPCGICLIDFDRLFGDDERSAGLRNRLFFEMSHVNLPVFFTGKAHLSVPGSQWNQHIRPLEFGLPGPEVRQKAWEVALAHNKLHLETESIGSLRDRFRFTVGQIFSAARIGSGSTPQPVDSLSIVEFLQDRCRVDLASRLPQFAVRVPLSPYTWSDLILPQVQITMLKDICARVRHQRTVLTNWGFGNKLTTGRGVNALFTGVSGTGKTMAAGIIALDLSLDMYKIDLSLIISKYIGETEKNLSAVFREAEAGRAILFFDEADALFGKRSNVKDAHDRYANIEVAYLLQKMEEYEGITILATNFRQNMDEAFTRRMHAIVEFPLPDREQRELLWKNVFPAQAPSDKLDIAFLARQFTITGANIKNIAINAAFYAAQNGGRITMDHVLDAIKREYTKTGSFIADDALFYSNEVCSSMVHTTGIATDKN